MAHASIPVDLRNPGQVFACLGLMEATELLTGYSEGRFAYTDRETHTRFELAAPGDGNPVETVLRFLAECEVVAIAPHGSELSAEGCGVRTESRSEFPAQPPKTPATLPVRLRRGGLELPVEYWLDTPESGRDNLKFWAGQGMGARLTRDAVAPLSAFRDAVLEPVVRDPFAFASPMTSSFRFDWRRDYVPLDAGFSPNVQSAVTMVGYPIVELLAAVGLQFSRPLLVSERKKLAYRYSVSSVVLPAVLARALLGCGDLGIDCRTFRMRLGSPGQEGKERCIISADEELR